ncbi:MAG: alginate export family protein [Bacteroidetes bacterium]|nr:alginate export family protein [Bacteroidota bacterium]
MKTSLKHIILAGTLVLAGAGSYAQLKITGEVRPRFEYRHGFQSLADSAMNPGAFTDQRTRITFDYKKDKLEFRTSLQDVRVWGSQSQLVTNEDYGVSVHEAFGVVHFTDTWAMKFGRQELVYDDHRMLGNVDWAQQARSHDGVVFQYRKEKLKLDFGGAYNQNSAQYNSTSYSVAKSYKTMQYAWANYKVNDDFNFSVLALGLGQQVNFINQAGDSAYQDNYTLTAGTRLMYKKNKFAASSNLFYQLGSTNNWPAKSVSGYLLNLDLSYQVKEPLKVFVGFEMISGNSQTDTSASYKNTQHAFNPYFGTNHKFNGYMDYFYVGNHIGNVGLNDGYLGVEYKKEKYTFELAGHVFMAQSDVLDVTKLAADGSYTAMSPYLGTEIDFTGTVQLSPGVQCKFGYSQMIATQTMEAIKSGDRNAISNWAYVMILFKPVLFEQKP